MNFITNDYDFALKYLILIFKVSCEGDAIIFRNQVFNFGSKSVRAFSILSPPWDNHMAWCKNRLEGPQLEGTALGLVKQVFTRWYTWPVKNISLAHLARAAQPATYTVT
jgi:hypothetical protein